LVAYIPVDIETGLSSFIFKKKAVNTGFKRGPRPFLAVANKTNKQVFRGLLGVNFASAGSGILDTTVNHS